MYELGLTIDVSTNWSSGPWFPCLAYCGSLSRSGPTLPFEAAGWYVWQPPHPFEANSCLPAAAFPFGSVVVCCGSVPSTAWAVGFTTPWLPQPAPRSGSAADRRVILLTLDGRPGKHRDGAERPEAEDVEPGIVDEQRDGEPDQQRVQ